MKNLVDDSWNWLWNKLSLEDPIYSLSQPRSDENLSANQKSAEDIHVKNHIVNLGIKTPLETGAESVQETVMELLKKARVVIEELLNINSLRQKLTSRSSF